MSSVPEVAASTPPHLAAQPLFSAYTLGAAHDEMFDVHGQPRAQYQALYDRLQAVGAAEMRQRQSAADLAFLHQGITFTVYGRSEGTEKIFPYDLIPRIITAAEWRVLDRGLTQRITALNLFLKDLYGAGQVLADGVVARDLVYSCKHFRREMQGVSVRHDVYVSVAGTDLVRLPDGSFAVLEDNLRVPSGVSYMLTNRQVIKRVFPLLFSSYDVRPQRIAEFLVLHAEFPRSIHHAAGRIQASLRALGTMTGRVDGRADRLAGRLCASLDYGHMDEIIGDLPGYLRGIVRQATDINAAVHQQYVAYPIEQALAG